MTSTAISMPASTARFQDIEAQAPARKFNPMATRAKMAGMAVVGTAGVIATALLASMDPTETTFSHTRELMNSGCSEKQLNTINRWKNALIGTGISTGVCLGVMMLGTCLGSTIVRDTGRAFGGLSLSGVLVTGINYGVTKNKC